MASSGPARPTSSSAGVWNGTGRRAVFSNPSCCSIGARANGATSISPSTSSPAGAQPGGPDLIRKALDGVPVFHMFPGPASVIKAYGDNGQSKAYEMMSCYEGLTELYRATGKPEYLRGRRTRLPRHRHDGNHDSRLRLRLGALVQRTRASTETMHEWMETCVTATWIKFSAQLLRLTGDSAYADRIERSAYNSLLVAQRSDGTWWSHISPLTGARLPAR